MGSVKPRAYKPTVRALTDIVSGDPGLASAVRALPANTLSDLIKASGLEDSSTLLALASTEQLEAVMDEDLWEEATPDGDRFDARRFLVWLEVMLEVGEKFTAERLEMMPEELVTLALQRSLVVLEADLLMFELQASEDSALSEKLLEATGIEEIAGFFVIARQADGWDTLVAGLTALDTHNHSFLQHILSRCSELDGEHVLHAGGLHRILRESDGVEADLAAARETRREQAGYVPKQKARAYLKLSRNLDLQGDLTPTTDPVMAAFLRKRATPRKASQRPEPKAEKTAQQLNRMIAAALSDQPHFKQLAPVTIEKASPAQARAKLLFLSGLEKLDATQKNVAATCRLELAEAANILVAGLPGPLRALDALMAVSALVNLGLEQALWRDGKLFDLDNAVEAITDYGAAALFRLGLATQHQTLAVPILDALIAQLPGQSDRESETFLAEARRAAELSEPWRVADLIFDLYDSLDNDAINLIQNCLSPLPYALRAAPDGNPFITSRNALHELTAAAKDIRFQSNSRRM